MIFFSTNSTIFFPDSYAWTCFSGDSASVVAHPGRLSPRVSVTQAMEFAVNRPAQLPAPGQQAFSRICRACWDIFFPEVTRPTASNALTTSTRSAPILPAFMGPPVKITAGMGILPVAMSMPGVILSQLQMPTHPSSE